MDAFRKLSTIGQLSMVDARPSAENARHPETKRGGASAPLPLPV